MTKVEPHCVRGGVCPDSRIRAWHQRLLQFRRHSKIGLHLLVFLANLAVPLFQLANVRRQKRVLYFEKRLSSDESKEARVFIDQQYVVVEILVGTRKHSAQDIADWHCDLDARLLLAEVLTNGLPCPKRKP
jgi:hypothetical protein